LNTRALQPLIIGAAILASFQCFAAEMPEPFRGVWQLIEGEDQTCKASDWSSDRQTDTYLKIDARLVRYHESECRFKTVTQPKQLFDGGAVHVAMTCAGEGERWSLTEVWQVFSRGHGETLVMANTSRQRPRIGLYRKCGAEPAQGRETQLKKPAPSTLRQPTNLRPMMSVGQNCFVQKDGGAEFVLGIDPSGSATFTLDVLNPRTKHQCYASGTAIKSARGWRYVDESCRLDIDISDRIRFRFSDAGCERRYCGARASITSVEFSGHDKRRSCPP